MRAADKSPFPENSSGAESALSAVREELARVRSILSEELEMADAQVAEMLAETNYLNGKMLRPCLLLLTGKLTGGITDQHILAAAVVEMIHNATLLHDDVIDEARVRRAGASANFLHGNERAVLLGDFILSRTFVRCCQLESNTVWSLLGETAAEICRGEIRQNLQKNNRSLGESEYLEIVGQKTASFFAACCKPGALLNECRDETVGVLAESGFALGTAFQITDDILDITGREQVTGKTAGSDIRLEKMTLPIIKLLEGYPEAQRGEKAENLSKADRNTLCAELENKGCLEYSRKLAEKYCQNARNPLSGFEASAAKTALLNLCDYITRRES